MTDTININGTTYIRQDAITHNSEIKIVVLQRGWVVVGRYVDTDDRVMLSDAHVIERWGTTEGLGQLRNGPLAETRLRKAGAVEAPLLGVVLTIACDADAWAGHL